LERARKLEPRADDQALVSLGRMRAATRGMSHARFDAAVVKLAEGGKVWLHRHAHPSEARLEDVVRDGKGNIFIGLVIRP